MSQLKEVFFSLAEKYLKDKNEIQKYWNEIESNYLSPKRFYHTLTHLENMVEVLEKVKDEITDYESVLWSVFYHDLVYDAERQDNEERSALKTLRILLFMQVPQEKVLKIQDFIISTKQHSGENDADLDYFLDADLSVLGADEEIYNEYVKNVRKEYAVYPDKEYYSGRKRVLEHFISMKRIFKTAYFYKVYEIQAKQNLEREWRACDINGAA